MSQELNQSLRLERRLLSALNSRRQPGRSLELSPPTGIRKTQTRCSSSQVARASASGHNKIRGFVADFELYLRMCARPVHHWGTF